MARKFAVLGSGNGGRAVCGQIAARGYDVVLFESLEATADYEQLRIKPERKTLSSFFRRPIGP